MGKCNSGTLGESWWILNHFPRYRAFVWGIHWSPVNSPHKGQWRGVVMFSLICAWINGWVNNREVGDVKRHGVIMTSLYCHWLLSSPVYLQTLYNKCHYNDVIMSAMASQITGVSIVCSTVGPGADKKIKAPRYWPLCGEFTGDRWIPHTKGQ